MGGEELNGVLEVGEFGVNGAMNDLLIQRNQAEHVPQKFQRVAGCLATGDATQHIVHIVEADRGNVPVKSVAADGAAGTTPGAVLPGRRLHRPARVGERAIILSLDCG